MVNEEEELARKILISNALTLAMGKMGWLAILAVLLIALTVYGLYSLFGQVDARVLRWLAVGLTAGLLPAFALGFCFGKVEVRGFLVGFDRALEGLSTAIDLRDASKERRAAITPATARPQPGAFNVYLPTITTRDTRTRDEFVEL